MLRKEFGISSLHLESFEWIPEQVRILKNGARLYKVKCMKVGETHHVGEDGKPYDRYFTEEEILQNGRSLAACMAVINLDHFQILEGRNCVVDSQFNRDDGDLECLIYVEDQMFHHLFDENHISGASVEFRWRSEKERLDGSLEQIGCLFNGLGIMTDRFGDKPASPDTLVERFLSNKEQIDSETEMTATLEQLERKVDNIKTQSETNATAITKLNEEAPTLEESIKKLSEQHGISVVDAANMLNVVKKEGKKTKENPKTRFEGMTAAIVSVINGKTAASRFLSGSDVTVDTVKTRLTELGKTRTKLEGQLFGDTKSDNEQKLLGELGTTIGEINTLEASLTFMGDDGKMKSEARGRLGLIANFSKEDDDDEEEEEDEDKKPTEALKEAWKRRGDNNPLVS